MRHLATTLTLLVLGFAAPALATPLLSNPGGSGPNTTGARTMGYQFQVTSGSVTVTALGYWDQDMDGLSGTREVGLWLWDEGLDESTLLASVSVSPMGGDLIDEYRYVDLPTPLELQAGNDYVLGGTITSGQPYKWWSTVVTPPQPNPFDPLVTPIIGRVGTFTTLQFPDRIAEGSNEGAYWTIPNLLIVPEPSAGILLGMGLVLLATRGRPNMRA